MTNHSIAKRKYKKRKTGYYSRPDHSKTQKRMSKESMNIQNPLNASCNLPKDDNNDENNLHLEDQPENLDYDPADFLEDPTGKIIN